MAERADVVIDWTVSPRIIEVASPSTELTVQDGIDTLRGALVGEESWNGVDEPEILKASGKEDLGGGVLVGITSELQNAQYAFEARTTPTESGTATSIGTLTLTDSSATFITNGVSRGATIINFNDYSVAEVLIVTSQTELVHRVLKGGTNNDWTIGDVYRIFNIVQCKISAGNQVAVDTNGDPMSAIFPTAFTQIILTASTSAALVQGSSSTPAEIATAVWSDTVSTYANTTGSFGQYIGKKLLTLKNFLGLK